jgi:hypothetical protein
MGNNSTQYVLICFIVILLKDYQSLNKSMASLIQGFEYDIFISYRQRDNKYDGWVTEFVDNLKSELNATIKEDVSVYFDLNPHDGLLVTHDVDASLKEKLKCLVFIPVISQTYCDPNSFAWTQEFKAFIKEASNDKYGLKIKLPNNNVASRVLPVRIHDLDIDDIKLFESVLGGTMRGVEFIYKSPGVNRPLRAREDKLQDNVNKTSYRDQINKVANAIKEVVSGIRTGKVLTDKESTYEPVREEETKKEIGPDIHDKPSVSIQIDRQLLRKIENDFPYPIALEFRRLNTKEYLAYDGKRLMQILKISETTIQLLSLISLADLLENVTKSAISVPDSFKRDFPHLFSVTSFGKWISLAKGCVKLFHNSDVGMFINELKGYFFEKDGSESKILNSFNILTNIRNVLAEPESVVTSRMIDEYCIEGEMHLLTILMELKFLMNYSFLYVDHISVKYPKWNNPSFFHTFSEVTGNSSEFNAYSKILTEIVNTPAMIIAKGSEEKDYLNLDPLLIYSNEGETNIADIFMFTGWDKNKTAKYKPVWNGGSFDLSGTTIEFETISALLKFYEFFAEQAVLLDYKGYAAILK